MFSLTSAAATYCGIMNPELSPPSWVRNAGRPSDSDGLTSRSTRRSEMDASSATAKGHGVERERDGLAVEVPVRDELSLVDEDEGVVRGRVDLDGDRVLDVGEEVAARTVHLWRATKRVGVLHLVAPAMRLDDRRALEEAKDVGGGGRLAGERAERLDLRHEADARALQRLDGEGARDVSGLGDPAGADEAECADGAHELRSVDEREPFLRLQADRLETGAGERVRPGKELALVARRPSPTRGSARWASGARSPEAPTEPRLGTTGGRPCSGSRGGARRSRPALPRSPSRARSRAAPSRRARPRPDTAPPPRTRGCAGGGAGAPRRAPAGSPSRRSGRSRC